MRAFAIFLLAFFLFSGMLNAGIVWSIPSADPATGEVAIVSGKGVFASQSGRVYGINLQNGTPDWVHETDGRLSLDPVEVFPGAVAIATEQGKLFVLSIEDGRPLFEREFKAAPRSLAAAGGLVFLSFDSRVVAVDLSGNLTWEKPFPKGTGQLGAGKDSLYFTSDGKLQSLSLSDGSPNWASDASNSFLSRPQEYAGSVYFGGTDGKIYAVDATDGEVRWAYQTGGWVMTTPTVASAAVFAGSNDGYFYSLTPDGGFRFSFKAGDGVWGRPALYQSAGNAHVAFATNGGKLFGLDANTGEERWSFSTLGKPGSPARAGQNFIFATNLGGLYALSTSPLCSFTRPKPGEAVGDWPVMLEGRAGSDASVLAVEARIAGKDWKLAEGTTNWSAELDFTGTPSGQLEVECRARDSEGNIEHGDYSSLIVIKSDSAPLQKMKVSAPKQSPYDKEFLVEVADDSGRSMKGVKVTLNGVEKISDSPIALVLGKSGPVALTIEKPGFETSTLTVVGQGGFDFLPIIAVLAAALAVAAYLLLFRKKQ